MKEMPKTAEGLSTHGEDVDAIETFILKYWGGLDSIKPKGYDEFLKDYTDFAGMVEWSDNERDDQEASFNGFDDFHFIKSLSVPDVAYSDTSQGRSPLNTFISAVMAYGFERGRIHSINPMKEKEAKNIRRITEKLHAMLIRDGLLKDE